MAVLAIITELRPVDIGVAVGAGHADVGESQGRMAVPAFDRRVSADKGKARLAMIEIYRLTQHVPTLGRVAGTAIPFQLAVWVLLRRRVAYPY